MSICEICPRECGIDRAQNTGFCRVGEDIIVSRIAPHIWEEPPISGSRGSGTVFFSGCNLRCVFCQNKCISHAPRGRKMGTDELFSSIYEMCEKHRVHNVNFVTPTHYTAELIPLMERIKKELSLPVVWNSSGYEKVDALCRLDGLVDIYLPDFKYSSGELSKNYSAAPNYPEIAEKALLEMHRQVGSVKFDADGIMMRGMIVRHLVLPACRHDSAEVLERIAKILPISDIRLSLMSQYTPEFAVGCEHKNLHRRVTSFEYEFVKDRAISLGFEGYFQERSSADSSYTPEFW